MARAVSGCGRRFGNNPLRTFSSAMVTHCVRSASRGAPLPPSSPVSGRALRRYRRGGSPVSPEQGQCPAWLAGGCAPTARHGVTVSARAWHLGRLILAAGRGSCPPPPLTPRRPPAPVGPPLLPPP